ncbi:MAG: alpha/beta hydrolase, partial [Rhodanobacter sp.]
MPATRAQRPTQTVLFCAGLLCIGMFGAAAFAQAQRPGVDSRGNVSVPAFVVPYSAYASPEAQQQFQRMLEQNRHAPGIGAIAASRAYYDGINTDRAKRMQELYPVKIHAETIGGVPADVVLPAQGIAAGQRHRVLINLHGGAFLWGAHSGGLVEAIPLASLGRIKVVSVDYRQGPEHVFPAASEDVEAV